MIKKTYILPTEYAYVGLHVFQRTKKSQLSPYSINCLVFITEETSVHCAVRTGYLNVMGSYFVLKGQRMFTGRQLVHEMKYT